MENLHASIVPSVLEYLTPKPTIQQGTPIAVVWGEGNRKSPCDKNAYHAGHLSMVCAVVGLVELGAKVTIFLTSDQQARANRGVSGPCYERRQRELIEWLHGATGKSDAITILDVPKEYASRRISGPAPARAAWSSTGEFFGQTCDEITAIKERINRVYDDEINLKAWMKEFSAARYSESRSKWKEALDSPNRSIEICSRLEVLFEGLAYEDKDADMAATAFLILKGGSLVENASTWTSQCGTVFSQKVGAGIMVESARNMYWLRCLRLLAKHNSLHQKQPADLPQLCLYTSLSKTNGEGAMRSKDRHTWVPIFATPDKIHDQLCNARRAWLDDFAVRLSWAEPGHTIARELATVMKRTPTDDTLRNGILDCISSLSPANHRAGSDAVRIDDWYCAGYLAVSFLNLSPHKRWESNITAAHVMKAGEEDNCSPVLAKQLLDKIDSRLTDPNERLFAKAVRKTVEWTGSIDLILHMMPKRYRDPGHHQLNVAAVADLLWTASSPTDDYTNAVTVAQATASRNGLWQGTGESLRDMSMLAALAHDHGYALLQVAWLLGRLHAMKLKKQEAAADKLAEALVEYVKPFASTWFRTEICDKIQSDTSDPCRFISPNNWSELSTGRYQRIVPEHPNHPWPGHGLMGAMNLWGLMDDNDVMRKPIQLPAPNRILPALHAIAIHDDNAVKVSIDDAPLSYMLAVADEIQEWNRRMFHDGVSHVESPYAELDGNGAASQYGLQLHRDELRVRFFHLGIEKTKVPWEYSYFRTGKRKNLDRASSAGEMFPKKVTFEMVVGP